MLVQQRARLHRRGPRADEDVDHDRCEDHFGLIEQVKEQGRGVLISDLNDDILEAIHTRGHEPLHERLRRPPGPTRPLLPARREQQEGAEKGLGELTEQNEQHLVGVPRDARPGEQRLHRELQREQPHEEPAARADGWLHAEQGQSGFLLCLLRLSLCSVSLGFVV